MIPLHLPPPAPVLNPPAIEWAAPADIRPFDDLLERLRADISNSSAPAPPVDIPAASKNAVWSFIIAFPMAHWSSGYIESIQQVQITIAASSTSNTATINSVSSLAFLVYQGESGDNTASAESSEYAYLQLTNPTTVTATRNGSTGACTVNAAVVDPKPALVTSIQQGTITIGSGATSANATITAVNLSYATVFYLGVSTAGTSIPTAFCGVELTSTTNVRAHVNTSGAAQVVGYVVVVWNSTIVASLQTFSDTSTANTTTDAVTITSVSTSNAVIIWGGVTTAATSWGTGRWRAAISSATNVNFVRQTTGTATRTRYFQVLEFTSGVLKSLQRSALTVNSVTSADDTISSVTTSKTLVAWNGCDGNGSADLNFDRNNARVKLFSSTKVRGEKDVASTVSVTLNYEAWEFS